MRHPKINQESKPTAILEAGTTLLQVAKFTGVAIIIVCGAMALLKVSKVMMKDLKDLGL